MLRSPYHNDELNNASHPDGRTEAPSSASTKHQQLHERLSSKRRISVSVMELDRLAFAASQKSAYPPSRPSAAPKNEAPQTDDPFADTSVLRSTQLLALQFEREQRPSVAMFQNNRDVLPTMRCKLVNWLIEVCMHFRLHRESLYLAVHYVDRYFTLHWGIERSKLQLIGIASLFIAAKLEEIYPPKLKDFESVCGGSCTCEDIFQTELDILMTLRWRLNAPTIYYWLGSYLELLRFRFSPKEVEDIRRHCIVLLDTAIHTPPNIIYRYSLIAAAILVLRIKDADLIYWASGYSQYDLAQCTEWLTSLFDCAEGIVYYDPSDRILDSQYDGAVRQNARVMRSLMDQMRTTR